MEKIEIEHRLTKDIKPRKFVYYCNQNGCKNIIATSHEEPDPMILKYVKDTPCSECVPLGEFIKNHLKR